MTKKKDNSPLIASVETTGKQIKYLIEKVQENNKDLKTIQFSKYKNLTEDSIKPLADALKNNTHVTQLDFSDIELSDSDLQLLLNNLNLSVTTLKFNQFPITSSSAKIIARTLVRINIATLEMNNIAPTPTVISILALGFKNPRITNFTFINNNITYEGFKPFQDYFRGKRKILVDLQQNKFNNHDGMLVCLDMFKNPGLLLKLTGNPITNTNIAKKLDIVLTQNENYFWDNNMLHVSLDKEQLRMIRGDTRRILELEQELKTYLDKSNNQNSKNDKASSSNQNAEHNLTKLEEKSSLIEKDTSHAEKSNDQTNSGNTPPSRSNRNKESLDLAEFNEELSNILKTRRVYFCSALDRVALNDSHIAELNFKGRKLTPDRIKDIADALEKAAEMATRLQKPTHIKYMDLSKTSQPDLLKESLQELAQAIEKYNLVSHSPHTLKIINLDYNNLSYESLKPLHDYIEKFHKTKPSTSSLFKVRLDGKKPFSLLNWLTPSSTSTKVITRSATDEATIKVIVEKGFIAKISIPNAVITKNESVLESLIKVAINEAFKTNPDFKFERPAFTKQMHQSFSSKNINKKNKVALKSRSFSFEIGTHIVTAGIGKAIVEVALTPEGLVDRVNISPKVIEQGAEVIANLVLSAVNKAIGEIKGNADLIDFNGSKSSFDLRFSLNDNNSIPTNFSR